MKKQLFYIAPLAFMASACVENQETGEMEPGWLFWVFLGFIVAGLIFGVIYRSVRSNKNNDGEGEGRNKTEEEIRSYEKTLEDKENRDKKE